MGSIIAVLEDDADSVTAARVRLAMSTVGGTSVVCRLGGRHVVVGTGSALLAEHLRDAPGVASVLTPAAEATLATRDHLPGDTVVDLAGVAVGDGSLAVLAGPCAVESGAHLRATALGVRARGAVVLRGGAYKPRTSPHAFQGLALEGLRMLADCSRATGLPVVTEAVDTHTLPVVARYAQVLQIGTRNAQNFSLLRAAGASGRPVLVKRGFGCTVDEWLNAAEYVLCEGNPNVVLCERGIRTFEDSTRFTLDLSAVVVVKQRSHLPVIVDPSHGTGHRTMVHPMALAAAAAGADGLLLDVHSEPGQAMCDAQQALALDEFGALVHDLRGMLAALGRGLSRAWRVPASQSTTEMPMTRPDSVGVSG